MSDWWENLSLRERGILLIASMVLGFILLDSLLISPVVNKRIELGEAIAQARDDLDWMNQAVSRLPDISTQGSSTISDERVIGYLDQQISRMGLKSGMQQMVPMEQGSARIRLNNVEFTRLLKFFGSIDNSFSIIDLRLQPSDTLGHVSVSLVVSNRS